MTRRRTAGALVVALLIGLNVILLSVQQRRPPSTAPSGGGSALPAPPSNASSLYASNHDQAPDESIDPRQHSRAIWRFSFNPYETPDPCPDGPDFTDAMGLFKSKRYADAARAFARVTERDPGCAAAHAMQSLCWLRIQRLEEAEEAAWKAVTLSPTEHNRTNLALVLFAAKKIPEAIHQYREVLRKNSKNFVALKNLANVLYLQGDVEACCALLERMMACYPTDTYAYLTLGQIRERQSQHQEALDPILVCTEVTEIAARYSPRNLAGRLLHTRPEEDGRAVAAMRLTAGQIQLKLNDYDGAIASFRASAAVASPLLVMTARPHMQFQTAWCLGLALERRGLRDHRSQDLEEALPLLQKALALSSRTQVNPHLPSFIEQQIAQTQGALTRMR